MRPGHVWCTLVLRSGCILEHWQSADYGGAVEEAIWQKNVADREAAAATARAAAARAAVAKAGGDGGEERSSKSTVPDGM